MATKAGLQGNGYSSEGGWTQAACMRTDGPTGRALYPPVVCVDPEYRRKPYDVNAGFTPREIRDMANGFDAATGFTREACMSTDDRKVRR